MNITVLNQLIILFLIVSLGPAMVVYFNSKKAL